MDLKSFAGSSSQVYRLRPNPVGLGKFARSIGAPEAESTEFLPTYLTVCREGEFELLRKLGIELRQVLHGEQEYHYASPIEVGDEIEYQTKLEQVFEKAGKGAKMHFMIFTTEVRAVRPSARAIGTCKSTIIFREAT